MKAIKLLALIKKIMTLSKQIKSKISKEGLLTISLDEVEVPEPGDDQVLIKVQALSLIHI